MRIMYKHQHTETLVLERPVGLLCHRKAATMRSLLCPLHRLQFATLPNGSNVAAQEQKWTSLDPGNGEGAIFSLLKACRFTAGGSTTSGCERRHAYHPLLKSIDTRQQILTSDCDRHSPVSKAQVCPSEQHGPPVKARCPALADAVHHSAPQHSSGDSTMRLPGSSVGYHFEVASGLRQSGHGLSQENTSGELAQ